MKVAFFDCFSGVAGDMILGAMVDAGLSPGYLQRELAKLGLKGYRLSHRKAMRGPLQGTKFDVAVPPRQGKRGLDQILSMIRKAGIPKAAKEDALAIFRRIGEVEAKIHGIPISKVHFHEVGAIDSIVDIVGACLGLHRLGIDKVFFTPPALGSGWIKAAHGNLPIPGPATLALLKGVRARWGQPCEGEWTTPTGAAVLAHFGTCKETLDGFAVDAIGYGLGSADPKTHPNALRLMLGQMPGAISRQGSGQAQTDEVWSLRTNIDDMPAELYGPLMERLLEAGALDVLVLPAQMKKNRPGHMVEVLAHEAQRDKLLNILLEETTTFGVRFEKMQRRILSRQIKKVRTPMGPVRFKMGRWDHKILKAVPEFEDCLRIARKKDLSLAEVFRRVPRYAPRR